MKTGWLSLWFLMVAVVVRGQTNAPGSNVLPPPDLVPTNILRFDADLKDASAKLGQEKSEFTFWVTNVSTADVAVLNTSSSCGCTVARLPSQPWVLHPLASGPIQITVDLRGRGGTVIKGVTVTTSAGVKALVVRIDMPERPLPTNSFAPRPVAKPVDMARMNERAKNVQVALGDRQAVFKGDCARCHSEPARGKTGTELFAVACGICHDAAPRAAMVPDLRQSQPTRSAEEWTKLISTGKPGTLMPGFGRSEQGPLTDQQIVSLVVCLEKGIPPLKEQPASTSKTNDTPSNSTPAPRRKW